LPVTFLAGASSGMVIAVFVALDFFTEAEAFSSFFSAIFWPISLGVFFAEISFLVAGSFTAEDFSTEVFFSADFLVVAISTPPDYVM